MITLKQQVEELKERRNLTVLKGFKNWMLKNFKKLKEDLDLTSLISLVMMTVDLKVTVGNGEVLIKRREVILPSFLTKFNITLQSQ